MKFPAEIETGDLLLRRYRSVDAPALRAVLLRSNTDLTRWIPVPGDVPTEDALAARLDELSASGRPLYGLWTSGGALVGTVSLEPLDEPWTFAIGYWLDVAQRGRGYATIAVAAVTRVCLEILRAVRVEIHVAPDNEPSLALVRRLGFQRIGQTRTKADAPLLDQYASRDPRMAQQVATSVTARDDAGDTLQTDDDEQTLRALSAWVPLCQYLVAHLPARVVSPDKVLVSVAGRDVHVLRSEASGHPWLVVSAVIGPEHVLSASAALAHNNNLAVGALALEDGYYTLRHAVPLEDLAAWTLRHYLELVGHEASRLAPRPTRDDDGADVFTNYTD